MDSIFYWNAVALEANRISHSNGFNEQTGPPLSARALGIVHLAMYDGYIGVLGDSAQYPPYLPDLPPAPPGANADAAVAGAAHSTLTSLFPSQRAAFDQALEEAGLSGPGVAEGLAFGRLVAERILADRADDPDASGAGYQPSPERFHHRVDPFNPGQGFHGPFYGARSKLFSASERHRNAPPPDGDGAEYLETQRIVRVTGIAPDLLGTLPSFLIEGLPPDRQRRTEERTLIGLFWAYDGANGIGTPPRLYNQIVRTVAENRNNSTQENARLFALINVAMADAGILSWEQKYLHDLWRPVVGIREHAPAMGPGASAGDNGIGTDTQLDWLPMGAPASNSTNRNFTPNFPAYPSGHATFGAAALHIVRRFYGIAEDDRNPDDLADGLTFVSDELNGVTTDNTGTVRPRHVRSFPEGLWQMIVENGRSRVWLGVHWEFDFAPRLFGIGGLALGLDIANDIYDTGMRKSTVGPG
ncbi:vanadium-dependent haloperoxidase [Nocardia sp. XZ_19_369]|uniref:vanadium-dependent haloperoxidase n=1 Tax=Nocardia sp. XZ_19_369 TaxID=2769487 RepID=UPI00188E6CC9|nr:vanadium-dependent haloperoxidase [Nocardia sp. XZ_19_369]